MRKRGTPLAISCFVLLSTMKRRPLQKEDTGHHWRILFWEPWPNPTEKSDVQILFHVTQGSCGKFSKYGSPETFWFSEGNDTVSFQGIPRFISKTLGHSLLSTSTATQRGSFFRELGLPAPQPQALARFKDGNEGNSAYVYLSLRVCLCTNIYM